MIDGVLWDKAHKSGKAVTLIGVASIVGLEVGGGPIMPPTQPPGGGQPPVHPEHPIWGPPGINLPPGPGFPPVAGHPLPPVPPGGGQPPGQPIHPIWGPPGIELPPAPGYPPVAGHPLPPISQPPPGQQPPTGPLGKMEWHSVWTADYGWAVIGVPVGPHPTPSAQSASPAPPK
jgi:hypothetical protein